MFERGWLSSNNVLMFDDDGGATLIDSGHCVHAEQTLALVRHALAGRRLTRVVNTHLHSDHCGGNAALELAFGVHAHIPPGQWQAVQRWDEDALSYRATGQRCERFTPAGRIVPGEPLYAGGRRWEVIAAPGHDPHSVILFDAAHGVLISADALWENGFGVIFPELEGESGFDEAAAVLDAIARLPVQVVIPGHGAPFEDAAGALARARARLAALRTDPRKHARHAAKVLLKYHLMEEHSQPLEGVLAWAEATPLFATIWASLAPAQPLREGALLLLRELADSGALLLDEGLVSDR